MLRFEGICKSFGARPVLRNLGATIEPGLNVLRGPNGIGKSTLLRILAGAAEPDAGRIWIDGLALDRDPQAARRRLAYAPDECPVYPFVTGQEWLAFVAYAKRCRVDGAARSMVERFGLAPHLGARCGAMSLGTQKKLMLAAAWIGEPAVILLDEPSNGLDIDARALLVECLVELQTARGREATVLVSTHDAAFAATLEARVLEFEALQAHTPARA